MEKEGSIMKEKLKKQIDEMSDEKLEKVAGGSDSNYYQSLEDAKKAAEEFGKKCPKCGKVINSYQGGIFVCSECGYTGI